MYTKRYMQLSISRLHVRSGFIIIVSQHPISTNILDKERRSLSLGKYNLFETDYLPGQLLFCFPCRAFRVQKTSVVEIASVQIAERDTRSFLARLTQIKHFISAKTPGQRITNRNHGCHSRFQPHGTSDCIFGDARTPQPATLQKIHIIKTRWPSQT